MACLSRNESSGMTPWRRGLVVYQMHFTMKPPPTATLPWSPPPTATLRPLDRRWTVLLIEEFMTKVSVKRGPHALGEPVKNKGGRRSIEETEALVGFLPPGGILNWNAQDNQSHSQRTDVDTTRWLRRDNISFIHGDHSCVSDTSALSAPSGL